MSKIIEATKQSAQLSTGYIIGHYKHVTNRCGQIIFRLLKLCIIVGISFIIITPLLGILSKAFMDINDYYNPLVYLVPINLSSYSIKFAEHYMDYFNSFAFTSVFSLIIMAIQAFICAVIGYGFARYRFPGSGFLFGLVILTIVVPVQTMMAPMYLQFRYFDPLGLASLLGGGSGVNLINTIWPSVMLSLTGMGLRSGLFIFIYRQFFKGLPKEIEEAALIDGAGVFRTFFQIMLPNALSSIIIVLLFAFVWQYNDTFFAGLFMNDMGLLSIRLNSLQSVLTQVQFIRDPNQISLIINAGVVLTIAPLIIIYLFMQRYFMEGIERSGIVG